MKKILLVFTGGTIGSSSEQGTIAPDARAGYLLLQLFEQHYPHAAQIEFSVEQPLSMLSENLQPSAWKDMIHALEGHDLESYDGIIMTHGTDTLAFSAAFLGVYFNQLKVPMLLVSSNYPLDHAQANGLDNFMCAVECIRKQKKTGVWVAYQNPGRAMHVHIATRLLSCLPLSGDFISVQDKPFMRYDNGRFKVLHPVDETRQEMKLMPQLSDILLLRPYPGLDYSRVNLTRTKIILHDLYHSGTACVSDDYGENYSLLAFADSCQRQGIKLYLAPALPHDDVYETTRQLLDFGVEIITKMTLETAYAKLLLAYGNKMDEQQIGQFLKRNIALERVGD